MADRDVFLQRIVAARTAAWLVLLISMVIQILNYVAYLGMQHGLVDGLIEMGVYGDVTRAQLQIAVFYFLAVLKLMNIGILMVALFLTLWVRGLRRQ